MGLELAVLKTQILESAVVKTQMEPLLADLIAALRLSQCYKTCSWYLNYARSLLSLGRRDSSGS